MQRGTSFHHWTRQGLLSMSVPRQRFPSPCPTATGLALVHFELFPQHCWALYLPVQHLAGGPEIQPWVQHAPAPCWGLAGELHGSSPRHTGNHPATEKPPGKPGVTPPELLDRWTTHQVLRAVSGPFSELIFPHPTAPFHRPHPSQVNESILQVFKAYTQHLCYQKGSLPSRDDVFLLIYLRSSISLSLLPQSKAHSLLHM